MLQSAELVAFVGTTDAERAKHFYAGVLGLRLLEQTEFACVFESGGAPLRVTVISTLEPSPHTVLGWRVDDVAASATELSSRGVNALHYDALEQDQLGIWTSPRGAKVLWFEDPDGNVLSLSEY